MTVTARTGSKRPSTPPKRESYHHGDVKRAVVDATLELLKSTSVESLSLREAARAVGVNHRAVYRHFEDKRALFALIAGEGYDALALEMRAHIEAVEGDDPVDRLIALGEGYIRFARKEPARYGVMSGPRLNEDERFPELEASIRRAIKVLEVELLHAAPPGTARVRIRDAGITLWATVHGIASLLLARRIRLKDAYVTRYVDTLLRPSVTGVVQALR